MARTGRPRGKVGADEGFLYLLFRACHEIVVSGEKVSDRNLAAKIEWKALGIQKVVSNPRTRLYSYYRDHEISIVWYLFAINYLSKTEALSLDGTPVIAWIRQKSQRECLRLASEQYPQRPALQWFIAGVFQTPGAVKFLRQKVNTLVREWANSKDPSELERVSMVFKVKTRK